MCNGSYHAQVRIYVHTLWTLIGWHTFSTGSYISLHYIENSNITLTTLWTINFVRQRHNYVTYLYSSWMYIIVCTSYNYTYHTAHWHWPIAIIVNYRNNMACSLSVWMERDMMFFSPLMMMCGERGDTFCLQLLVPTKWNWYVCIQVEVYMYTAHV